jgi:hypothetical protein
VINVTLGGGEGGGHIFSSPCQRQCELLRSLGACRPLTFHILIFSSKTTLPNELKLGYFLPSFSSFAQAVSEENIKKNRPIKNKNCLWWPCLFTDRDEMCKLYKGPSIDASYQVSVYFAERFQRRSFLKIDQSKTRIACGAHIC